MASIFGSVQNLVTVANNKVDQISSVAKGILCLPSILSSLPSILGGLGASVLGSIYSQFSSIGGALTSLITDTINQALGAITGAITNILNKVLSLQAEILGAINLVKDFVDGLTSTAKDIKNFVSDSENCKFAASELAKCIAASLIGDLSNKIVRDISGSTDKIDSYIGSITAKIAKPGEIIDKYVNKQSSMVDKATTQIQAMKIF